MLPLSRLAVAIAPGSLALGLATLPFSGPPAQAAGVGLTGPFALNNWKLIPTVNGVPATEFPVSNPGYICNPSFQPTSTACVDGPSLSGPSSIQTTPTGGFTVVGARTGDYGSTEGQEVDIAWRLQYTGDVPYKITFDYYFESGDSADQDKGYFKINDFKQIQATSNGQTASGQTFVITKNDFITFGVLSVNVNSFPAIGSLQVTNFDATEVPAPLPLLGAGAALGWSRRLRRRIRSRVAMASR